MSERAEQETPMKPKGLPLRVGWLCTYTPVEILMAAGLQPVRLLGTNSDDATSRAFLPVMLCPYIKACLGQALTGNAGPLEGMVITTACDGLRRLADIWARYTTGFAYTLDVPRRRDDEAVAYFRENLLKLARFLAERYRPVTEDALRVAIAGHNETRRLLLQLDGLRQKGMGTTAGEIMAIFDRAVQEPPESFNGWLIDFLQGINGNRPASKGIPIVISGNILMPDDRQILDLVEAAGGQIVGDDLCSGMRPMAGEVATVGDPFLNLAKYYLERVPCSRMAHSTDRFEELVRLCRQTEARGVLYLSQKFCDCFLYEFAPLRARLAKEGISALLLELDAGAATIGQAQTRIEAFLEIL